MNYLKMRAAQVAAVAAAGFAALAGKAYAVDPDLTSVTSTFTGHVSSLLIFLVAVIGAFIGAALIVLGLKFIWGYIRKLIGMGK